MPAVCQQICRVLPTYVGREYSEEQDVILALQQHIVLPSNCTVGMDLSTSMREHSKAIYLSPWGYIRLQGGIGLSPNPSGHHIALVTDWYRSGHVPNHRQCIESFARITERNTRSFFCARNCHRHLVTAWNLSMKPTW